MDNLMPKLCPIKYTKFRDFTFLANIIHAVHLSTNSYYYANENTVYQRLECHDDNTLAVIVATYAM